MIITVLLTLFLVILVPVYWRTYGWQNFLWLSDVGLFITCIALWLKSSLLLSIVALAIIPVELLWNIDFFTQFILSRSLIGLSSYMFDKHYSLFIRGLSLFHCVLPIIIVIYLAQWGYTSLAVPYSFFLVCGVLLLTYFVTDPDQNINWVFIPQQHRWHWMPSFAWLVVLILIYVVFIGTMHVLLETIFG